MATKQSAEVPSSVPKRKAVMCLKEKIYVLDGNQELFPCEVCGRRFAADVLERHGPICKKLFNKKRKPFNSLKQRLQGTDIPTMRKVPQSKSQPMRKSNWRQQHEDFIKVIRSAKQCRLAIRDGQPLPPPPAPSINPECLLLDGGDMASPGLKRCLAQSRCPINIKLMIKYCLPECEIKDYIQCPYCMRRFNETAAQRHINFCKNQPSRRVFDPAQTAAKLASRDQGRAQMGLKKEPTVTSAMGALLQNRALEATSGVLARSELAMDPASGAKLRQGLSKSSKKD